ncbi:hypothetical protein IHE61_23070 [Streptomyces sp. GKU 257-1]|nr:hypothetical protein [Streptomyces sp. GKU 257-1]
MRDDGDGGAGVVHHRVHHGSDMGAEAGGALPPSDHQQSRVLGGLDQQRRRLFEERPDIDLHAGMPLAPGPHLGGDGGGAFRQQFVQGHGRPRQGARPVVGGRLPAVPDLQRCRAAPGGLEGEVQHLVAGAAQIHAGHHRARATALRVRAAGASSACGLPARARTRTTGHCAWATAGSATEPTR